jgi:hypothetical protein
MSLSFALSQCRTIAGLILALLYTGIGCQGFADVALESMIKWAFPLMQVASREGSCRPLRISSASASVRARARARVMARVMAKARVTARVTGRVTAKARTSARVIATVTARLTARTNSRTTIRTKARARASPGLLVGLLECFVPFDAVWSPSIPGHDCGSLVRVSLSNLNKSVRMAACC